MGKFVRRHRVGVAAGAVVLLALIAGLAGATYGLVRATRAEAQARQEAATAEQVSEFLVGLFEVSDPSQARGNEITAREILDQGAERISRELQDQPLVRARLMTTMAQVYGFLGIQDKGRALAEEALEIRREELGNQHADVADSLMTIAGVTFKDTDLETSRSLFEQAIATYEKSLGREDLRIAEGLAMISLILGMTGRGEEALPLMERVVAIDEKLLSAQNPGEWATLAVPAEATFMLDGMRPLLEREIEIREHALGPDDHTTARCLYALGLVLHYEGDSREARRVLERSLEITERALGSDHPELFANLSTLALLCTATGDFERARVLMERSVALNEKVHGPGHFRTAMSLTDLGALLLTTGEYEEAAPLLERALAIFEPIGGMMDVNTGETLLQLARLRSKTGDFEQAQELVDRGMSFLERSVGPESPTFGMALYKVGKIQLARGDTSRADSTFKRAQAIIEPVLGENHPDLFYNRACCQALFGRRDEAIRNLRRAVEVGFNRYEQIIRDPDMDSLRGDPEFEAIVAEVKQRAEAEFGQ
jgi:tetratricopeptide (TPR) repeat protein